MSILGKGKNVSKSDKSDKEAVKRQSKTPQSKPLLLAWVAKRATQRRPIATELSTSPEEGSGVEAALSTGAVHMLLLERGLQPIEVSTKRSMLTFEITKKKVPRTDVMNFTRQLAVFMKREYRSWRPSKSSWKKRRTNSCAAFCAK